MNVNINEEESWNLNCPTQSENSKQAKKILSPLYVQMNSPPKSFLFLFLFLHLPVYGTHLNLFPQPTQEDTPDRGPPLLIGHVVKCSKV